MSIGGPLPVSIAAAGRGPAPRAQTGTPPAVVICPRPAETVFRLSSSSFSFYSSLLSPDVRKLDPRDFDLKKDQLGSGKTALLCVDIKTHRRKDGTWPVLPGAAAHFFCFEPGEPLLRLARDAEVLNFEFYSLKKFQNRVLAGSITIAYGNQKLLAFTVDTIGPIAGDEAAVTPPADAKPSAPLGLSGPSASQARLTKKAVPVYPEEAKAEHISGTVVLAVMVGSDGKVRDLRVVGSPSPSLTKSSLECISNWQYTPYLADGQPLEVNTLVTVIYALSR